MGLVGECRVGEFGRDRAPAPRPHRGVERVAQQRAVQLSVRVSVPASREHGLDAPGLDPEAVVTGLADRAGAAVLLPAAAERDALPAARIDPVVDRDHDHDLVPFRFGLQGAGGGASARARSEDRGSVPQRGALLPRMISRPAQERITRITRPIGEGGP